MKSTGMLGFSFLKTFKQSIENMSQLASFAALFFTKQSTGFSINSGKGTLCIAIRSITVDRLRKGESRISPFTSQEYIQANMIAQRAPMLLPQRVTLSTAVYFLTSCRTSLISKTQLIPQVRVSGSLQPQPRKSKPTTLILNLGINGVRASASSLLPPFPCRYMTVCSASIYGEQNKYAEMFLLFLLLTSRSFLTTLTPFMSLQTGPSRCLLEVIFSGLTISFHAFSYIFIFSPIYKQLSVPILLTLNFQMSIKEITLQLVLKFLKDKGYTESFLHLEIQSKANLREYPKEIQFFKKILLKGDFNQAVQFIWAFQQKIPTPTLKKLTLQIYKQKLYELLENPEESELRNLFEKQIINVCSQQEYQHLFTLLTCRSVKEIPGMNAWSSMKGRYACFEQIQPHLENFFNISPYQKNTNRFPSFGLEEAIQSFIIAEQRVQQRMEKSQNVAKPVGSIGSRTLIQKQSSQSLQFKPPKLENESKLNKYDQKFQEQKQKVQKPGQGLPFNRNLSQKPSYLASSQNNQISQSNIKKSQLSSGQEYRRLHDDIQISQSRVEKATVPAKYDRPNLADQEDMVQASTFAKKYNPYIDPTGYQKAKQQNKSSVPFKNYSVEDEDDREKQKQKERPGLGYKDLRLKERQNQLEKEKMKLNKPPLKPSYLKQFEKDANDSEVFQEEVRRNIAYLDQNNNSVVYKDEENQNFTFSNGAEESGVHQKNRKIFKLATFSDPKAIRTCQFSPSGNFFSFGTNSSYLKIYDIQQVFQTNQFKEIVPTCQIPQLHTKSIYCLDWSSNEKAIATCSNDLTIKITQFVDNFNFSNYRTNVIGRHESSVRLVKFNSLENRLISCGDDSLLKVWDIGKIKKCTNLKGHTQSISAFKFADREQDNILYSVSKDCTVKKWDLRLAECVTTSEMHDCELTFIADNIDRIVVSDKTGNVLFFNENLQLEHSVKIHEQQIRSIDGSSYEDLLLTASFDGHISIFSEKSFECPNYYQHNQKLDDKVVYATFLDHPDHHGFASTSTMGICNIYSFE